MVNRSNNGNKQEFQVVWVISGLDYKPEVPDCLTQKEQEVQIDDFRL